MTLENLCIAVFVIRLTLFLNYKRIFLKGTSSRSLMCKPKWATHCSVGVIGTLSTQQFLTSNSSSLEYKAGTTESMNNAPVRVINTCRLQETLLSLTPTPYWRLRHELCTARLIPTPRRFFLEVIYPNAIRKCFLSRTFCISPCWQGKMIQLKEGGRGKMDWIWREIRVYNIESETFISIAMRPSSIAKQRL